MGIAVVRIALIAAALLSFFHALPAAGNPRAETRAYGRELIAQHPLPAETVARFAAMTGNAAHDDARRAVAFEAASAWFGPAQPVGAGNPYTLVLTVSGTARAAGEVRSQWQAGWEVRESPVATREVLLPLTAAAPHAAAAGVPVTLTAKSTPLSFRNERLAAPMLNLVAASNLDIDDVRLQVWSGSAPVSLPGAPLPRQALLAVGALCLLAGWGLKRRRPRPAMPAVAPIVPPPSTLPAFDGPALPQHEPLARRPLGLPAPAPQPLPVPVLVSMPMPVPMPVPVPVPTLAPAAAAPSTTWRVVAALHDVLNAGLSVRTELDPRARRRKPQA